MSRSIVFRSSFAHWHGKRPRIELPPNHQLALFENLAALEHRQFPVNRRDVMSQDVGITIRGTQFGVAMVRRQPEIDHT